MTLDPREAQRLIDAEQDIARRRFQFASELTEADELRQLSRKLKGQMAAYNSNPTAGMLACVAGRSPHEKREYSISKLVADMMKPGRAEMSLERELSSDIAEEVKQRPQRGGCYVPLRIAAATAGLDSTSNSRGGYLVQAKVANIIDALQAQTKVLQLGGRLLTGLRFARTFPVETAATAATWLPENGGSDLADSNPTFGHKTMTPHTLSATTTISKQLLQQSSADLENWLRSRLGKAHAQALDLAAIAGTAVENQPVGLLNTQDIGDVPSSGTVTATHIRSLEAAVGGANADVSTSAFLATPGEREILRTIPELTDGLAALWQGNSMLGYRAETSNQMPSNALVFGDWSSIILGEFLGALEITADPLTSKKSGLVEITSFGLYDVLISQPTSFACIQDIS